MSISQSDITVTGIDTKALSGLIIEFNIARRNFRSYPPGHPLIERSINRLLTRYEELMGPQYELSLGVARDSLMFDNVSLDKNNPVYRDFARVLFQAGIGLLIFRPGLTASEANSFLDILNMKREEISQAGGIADVWQVAGIESLGIQAIRYDLFTASEGASTSGDTTVLGEGLWERFARGLAEGNLDDSDGSSDVFNPELLAMALNKSYSDSTAGRKGDYVKAITDYMHQTEHEGTATNNVFSDKLVRFISSINPELRLQFLNSAFENAGSGSDSIAKRLENGMSSEAVLGVLDDISQRQMTISPVIMGLLQKLSLHAPQPDTITRKPEVKRDDFSERMRSILREQASEEYVPEVYQHKLNSLVSARQLPIIRHDEIEPLMASLDSHQIESHISTILLELINGDHDQKEFELLATSLSDMGSYFLQTGDYSDYLTIIEQAGDSSKPDYFRRILMERCTEPDSLEEVLNGLHVWGKSRYDQIKELIWKIGIPFIEPLLNHLAVEESISMRRFLMERLAEFGLFIYKPIISRLQDQRWYFLRNLIVLLKNAEDPDVVMALRPLTRHAHPRVRLEAFKTLLSCQDSYTERQILRDLESDNRETQLAAIHLAEATRFPLSFNGLLQILGRGG
ncbi:MAG: HEAT repeat domain-containing protein, partial [Desulfobacteraceae bacterium]|nr:HEAT repeat domain-containing protein [Desulfobacteraceae bacterium]